MWGTILLWQQFLEQRAQVVGQKMQREIQKEVVTYLKSNKIDNSLCAPPTRHRRATDAPPTRHRRTTEFPPCYPVTALGAFGRRPLPPVPWVHLVVGASPPPPPRARLRELALHRSPRHPSASPSPHGSDGPCAGSTRVARCASRICQTSSPWRSAPSSDATVRSLTRWSPTRTDCSSRRCSRRPRTPAVSRCSATSSPRSASGSPRARRCSRCSRRAATEVVPTHPGATEAAATTEAGIEAESARPYGRAERERVPSETVPGRRPP